MIIERCEKEIKKMTPSVFAAYDVWVRNRNEKDRVGKIVNRVKKDPITEQYYEVALVTLPNGKSYRINGNTRVYGWQENLLPIPNLLEVTEYKIPKEGTKEDWKERAHNLYCGFDSSEAHENGSDKMTGSLRGFGIEPISKKIRTGVGIAKSIEFALPIPGQYRYDKHGSVDFFKNELEALDSLFVSMAKKDCKFKTPTEAEKKLDLRKMCAALMIIKRDGLSGRALEFISHMAKGTNEPIDGCPLLLIKEEWMAIKYKEKGKYTPAFSPQQKDVAEHVEFILYCYEKFKGGKTAERYLSPRKEGSTKGREAIYKNWWKYLDANNQK